MAEAITGAFVSLLTRAFDDEEDENGTEKLVSLLDLLQHSATPNVRHAMRVSSDRAVEVRARRDLKADEELLNQYSSEEDESMPKHRFFTGFGFVPGEQTEAIQLIQEKSKIFFAQKAEV